MVHGINGVTIPETFKSHRPEFIMDVHNFSYEPSKIVGELASVDATFQVAIDLLEFLVDLVG
jgi:hypothetical protein